MPRNGEGESVATMWARLVAEAERGEIVAIDNKWGEPVAVMMSAEHYRKMVWQIEDRADFPE